MREVAKQKRLDTSLILGISFLLILGLIILTSIAPVLFPSYFLYYVLGIIFFIVFFQIGFEILNVFAKQLYILSIVLLLLPLFLGTVTRGAIRWVPIGALTIQPTEIVRPFILIFFANFLTEESLTSKRLVKALLLLALPVFLILIQPSLGVAILTTVGVLGIFFASPVKKKNFLTLGLLGLLAIPIFWSLLAPYQKTRIVTFIDPLKDPLGAGYNSIQSMMSVGSGKLFGRGLGKGVQTQLEFLPERHSDFIFAAIGEELGFVGATLTMLLLFFVFWRITQVMEKTTSPAARAYVAGFFLATFVQTMIHIGMNMGLLPITGVPLPLVSAGGSSLLATMIGLGILMSARK